MPKLMQAHIENRKYLQMTTTITTEIKTVTYMNAKRLHTFRILLICVIAVAFMNESTLAASCSDFSVEYTKISLQNGRALVKGKGKSTYDKVKCAETILSSPALNDVDTACKECAFEYAGLLSDAAYYMRLVADNSVDRGVSEAYYEKELKTRQTLDEFLETSESDELNRKYFRINFEGIADDMEELKMGFDYRTLALSESDRRNLSPKSFEIWARAVRSCNNWNFASSFGSALLKNLCSEDCEDDFRAIMQRSETVGPDSRSRVTALLPPIQRCGGG